jgi:6,7-dimethyl-8-ribityllumazine synthase
LTASEDGAGLHVAVAWSRFNEEVTAALLAGALAELVTHGVERDAVAVVSVPGAFELPLVAKRLAASGRFDAVLVLGAVIRGETGHYDVVANECARGVARAGLDTGVPVIFGVLTTDTVAQAVDRAGGRLGNKGADTARVAIEMANLMRLVG